MNRKRVTIGFLLLLMAALVFTYTKLTAPPPVDGAANVTPTVVPAHERREETEEEKQRRQLLGTWQDHYKGKRTMTLNADGTGTMVVELTGLQATLFAPKLRFDMTWSLTGKTFSKKTTGGEPADKVNLILNTMGNSAADTILELTHDRLLLLDANGNTRYDWQRLEREETEKK
jgi:hypothetical protein